MVALAGLPAVTWALGERRDEVLLSTPVLLVLSVVVAVAIVGGIRPALPAAISGFLLLDFVFTEPYGTFDVHRFDQGLALAVYLATAVAVSVVVGIAARRHSQALRAAAEAGELSTLAGAQVGEREGIDDVLRRIRDVFRLECAAVVESVGCAPMRTSSRSRAATTRSSWSAGSTRPRCEPWRTPARRGRTT